MKKLRRRIFEQMDSQAWPGQGLSPVNKLIVGIVLFSVATVVIETEKSISELHTTAFDLTNTILAGFFIIEYVVRLWVMGEHEEYAGIRGRVRYVFTLTALIDFIAVAPFLLGLFGSDAFVLRVLRLARIFALAKLGKFSVALQHLGTAVGSRKYELFVSASVALLVMFVAAIMMYLVEGDAQPEAFGSIPRAVWWSMATLTTIGYGDVYPITVLGKLLAGITALASLALVALPAGILAAAFSEAFQQTKEEKSASASPDSLA